MRDLKRFEKIFSRSRKFQFAAKLAAKFFHNYGEPGQTAQKRKERQSKMTTIN